MKIRLPKENELTFKWVKVTYLLWFSTKPYLKKQLSSQVYLRSIKRCICLHIKKWLSTKCLREMIVKRKAEMYLL